MQTTIKDLIKFSQDNIIYVNKQENIIYVYSYNKTNILYIKLENSNHEVEKPFFVKGPDIIDLCDLFTKEQTEDTEPFDFKFETVGTSKEISANQLINLVQEFTPFLNPNSYREETKGIHFRNNQAFGSDTVIIRIKESKILGKDVNMVLDFNPFIEFLEISQKDSRIKGKSLFSNNTVKNDNIKISIIKHLNNDAIHVSYKTHNFIIISSCKSTFDFTYIENLNITTSFVVNKSELKNKISELLSNTLPDDLDFVENYIRFELTDKLILSNYKYYEQGPVLKTLKYNKNFINDNEFVLNGKSLQTILNNIQGDNLQIDYCKNGTVCKISNTSETFYLSQTSYR